MVEVAEVVTACLVFEMGTCPGCRAIDPGSSPEDGKLRASEFVNALHAHSHDCAKMPSLGVEPATITPAAQTITQLTKWYGGAAARILQTQNGTAARPGGAGENGKMILKWENGKKLGKLYFHFPLPFYFLFSHFISIFPFCYPPLPAGSARRPFWSV